MMTHRINPKKLWESSDENPVFRAIFNACCSSYVPMENAVVEVEDCNFPEAIPNVAFVQKSYHNWDEIDGLYDGTFQIYWENEANYCGHFTVYIREVA